MAWQGRSWGGGSHGSGRGRGASRAQELRRASHGVGAAAHEVQGFGDRNDGDWGLSLTGVWGNPSSVGCGSSCEHPGARDGGDTSPAHLPP